jgi:hypothetical protein
MNKAAQGLSGSIREPEMPCSKITGQTLSGKENQIWAESSTCGSHRNQTGTQQPIINRTNKIARSNVY